MVAYSLALEQFEWAIIKETRLGGPGFRYEKGSFLLP